MQEVYCADGRAIQLPAEYPGAKGYNQTKEPRASAKLLSAMQRQADWEAIASRHGETRALWVWRWHFNPTERAVLLEIIRGECEQQNLFDEPENSSQ